MRPCTQAQTRERPDCLRIRVALRNLQIYRGADLTQFTLQTVFYCLACRRLSSPDAALAALVTGKRLALCVRSVRSVRSVRDRLTIANDI